MTITLSNVNLNPPRDDAGSPTAIVTFVIDGESGATGFLAVPVDGAFDRFDDLIARGLHNAQAVLHGLAERTEHWRRP